MIRFKIRTAMIGAMALVALSAFTFRVLAQGAEPLKLETVDVLTSGQQVQLKLHLSGPAPEPLPFTIDKPARIAFDLPNTTLALASRRIDVHSGGVDTRARRGGQWPHAAGGQRRPAAAVHDQGRRQHIIVDARSPAARCRGRRGRRVARRRLGQAVGAGRTDHQDHRLPPRLRRHRPRDRAARPIRARRSTCARKAIRWSWISPAR